MDNRYEIAEQNGMSREFADWFFDNKKAGCGSAWFVMMAVMWEGWKGSTAMLQDAEHVTTPCELRDAVDAIRNSGIAIDGEKILAERDALNSPVIPDGWVILPAEPTQAMMNAWLSEVANWRGHAAGYRAMIAAAPQQEAKNV
ncbi:hypothetical protein SedNR2807_32290 [Citrobacter sedlakii]